MATKQHRMDSSYKNKSKDAHVECAAILYGLRMSMTDTSQKEKDRQATTNDNSKQVGNKEGASKMLYRAISFSFCSVEKQRT